MKCWLHCCCAGKLSLQAEQNTVIHINHRVFGLYTECPPIWRSMVLDCKVLLLLLLLLKYIICFGTAVAQCLMCCATNREVAGSIPASVSGYFFDLKSFRSHNGPGVDSASNRNEYQEYFLGGKGGRCLGLTTYHHPVPLSCNLGTITSWNHLGPCRHLTGLI